MRSLRHGECKSAEEKQSYSSPGMSDSKTHVSSHHAALLLPDVGIVLVLAALGSGFHSLAKYSANLKWNLNRSSK